MLTLQDRAALLAAFGESIQIDGQTLTAVVELAGVIVDPYSGGPGVESAAPAVTIAEADAPAGLAHGMAATVRGVAYKVRGILPDGEGFTRLELVEV